MSRIFLLTFLFSISSCATKYMVEGNRFVTPEVLGRRWQTQVEYQQTNGTHGLFDIENGKVDNPLVLKQVSASSYLVELGLFKKFDLFVKQTLGSVATYNFKWQMKGQGKRTRQRGHKFAFTAGYGTSTGKIKDEPQIDFGLTAQDFSLIHGYRWKRGILFYDSLSYTQYRFDSKFSSTNTSINGLEIQNNMMVIGLQGGLELAWKRITLKAEVGYQQLKADNTPSKTAFSFGYGAAFLF